MYEFIPMVWLNHIMNHGKLVITIITDLLSMSLPISYLWILLVTSMLFTAISSYFLAKKPRSNQLLFATVGLFIGLFPLFAVVYLIALVVMRAYFGWAVKKAEP